MSQKPVVRIDAKIHRSVKVAAATLGVPINSIVDDAVRDWVKRHRRKIEGAAVAPLTQPEGSPAGA